MRPFLKGAPALLLLGAARASAQAPALDADTLLRLGIESSKHGEMRHALDWFSQARSRYREMGYRRSEAAASTYLGVAYDSLGGKTEALACYGRSQEILHSLGDRAGEAGSLEAIGRVYRSMGEEAKALLNYQKALVLQRALKQDFGAGDIPLLLAVLLALLFAAVSGMIPAST